MSDRGIDRLVDIMARLRDPDTGCPWDIEQNFRSIAPYTLEEACEVVDAIERDDLKDLCDELGDLLLQVVFHARMAEEQGVFDFEEVAAGIWEKMVRRHPHVFADNGTRIDAEQLRIRWENDKAREREARRVPGTPASALDDVALGLPALVRAVKIQKRAARVGFDWPEVSQVRAKLDEELAELDEACASGIAADIEDELGDVLFSVANLARHLELDAEGVLRRATRKFDQRFRCVESLASERDQSMDALDIDALEALWQDAKRQLRTQT